MSTAIASWPTATRLLTAADLHALPTNLPSGDVRYELHHGNLVIMTPPGDAHAASQANVVTELKIQGERRGFGKARAEVAIILARDPDLVRGADAAFVLNGSLPIQTSPEGYLLTIPELVVEVRSKNDTQPEIDAKVEQYLTAGVHTVWVLDGAKRTVVIHRSAQLPLTLTETEHLTAEDLIPGFRVLVADLFVT